MPGKHVGEEESVAALAEGVDVVCASGDKLLGGYRLVSSWGVRSG